MIQILEYVIIALLEKFNTYPMKDDIPQVN